MRYEGHPEIVVHRDRAVATVVALSGEHDQYSAPALAKTIELELAAGRNVVVDLGSAGFLDSTSAGVLLAANANATTCGARLVVLLPARAGAAVRRLFETARLGTVLTVVATEEAALRTAERRSGAERRTGRAAVHATGRGAGRERRSGAERRSA